MTHPGGANPVQLLLQRRRSGALRVQLLGERRCALVPGDGCRVHRPQPLSALHRHVRRRRARAAHTLPSHTARTATPSERCNRGCFQGQAQAEREHAESRSEPQIRDPRDPRTGVRFSTSSSTAGGTRAMSGPVCSNSNVVSSLCFDSSSSSTPTRAHALCAASTPVPAPCRRSCASSATVCGLASPPPLWTEALRSAAVAGRALASVVVWPLGGGSAELPLILTRLGLAVAGRCKNNSPLNRAPPIRSMSRLIADE